MWFFLVMYYNKRKQHCWRLSKRSGPGASRSHGPARYGCVWSIGPWWTIYLFFSLIVLYIFQSHPFGWLILRRKGKKRCLSADVFLQYSPWQWVSLPLFDLTCEFATGRILSSLLESWCLNVEDLFCLLADGVDTDFGSVVISASSCDVRID